MDLNKKNVRKILLIVTFGIVLFCAVWNFSTVFDWILKIISFFRPIITALCIAFVLNVLLSPLETKVFAFMDKAKNKFVRKLKRPICLILTYLIALGLVTLLISVIIPDLIKTITYLAEKLPSFMADAKVWSENLLERFNLSQSALPHIKIDWTAVGNFVKDYFTSYSNKIFGSAVNITSSLVSGVYEAVFSFLISIYILAQKERIGGFVKRFIDSFIPEKAAKFIHHVSLQTHYSFSKFISGQLTESVILGLLCFIGMKIFGFPNAAIISLTIGVTSLVPIVGATFGVIIGFLLILITNPIKAVFFVIFILVLQQLEGSFIYPKVVGKSVGLPGVIVICAVLVGGNIGGILGALISVPLSAVVFVLIKEAMEKSHKLKIK